MHTGSEGTRPLTFRCTSGSLDIFGAVTRELFSRRENVREAGDLAGQLANPLGVLSTLSAVSVGVRGPSVQR